jgi:hypothetical protein
MYCEHNTDLNLVVQEDEGGYYLQLLLFFFCRVIDAFVDADRKGYKIRVSNDKVYVKHPDTVYCDLVQNYL